jgi:hypothetical protein
LLLLEARAANAKLNALSMASSDFDSSNLLPSFLACKDIMPVAAMLISPTFDLHEAMMAPELCNPKMDPVLISKKVSLMNDTFDRSARLLSSNIFLTPVVSSPEDTAH